MCWLCDVSLTLLINRGCFYAILLLCEFLVNVEASIFLYCFGDLSSSGQRSRADDKRGSPPQPSPPPLQTTPSGTSFHQTTSRQVSGYGEAVRLSLSALQMDRLFWYSHFSNFKSCRDPSHSRDSFKIDANEWNQSLVVHSFIILINVNQDRLYFDMFVTSAIIVQRYTFSTLYVRSY